MVMPPTHFTDIVDGLTENGLLERYSHILTGYLGSAGTIEAVCEVIKRIRQANKQLIYVLDPVMGDEGKLYVKPEVVPLYRDRLCCMADLITPNQFELELLTGHTIRSITDAQMAVCKLQECVPIVVLTSFSVDADGGDDKWLYLMGCCGSSRRCFTIKFPKRPGYFTGTGDLFAALLLAHYSQQSNCGNDVNSNDDDDEKESRQTALANACETAVEIMQSVLDLTATSTGSGVDVANNSDASSPTSRLVRGMELRLIESRHLFAINQSTARRVKYPARWLPAVCNK